MTFHEMLIRNRDGLPARSERPIPEFPMRFVGLLREKGS